MLRSMRYTATFNIHSDHGTYLLAGKNLHYFSAWSNKHKNQGQNLLETDLYLKNPTFSSNFRFWVELLKKLHLVQLAQSGEVQKPEKKLQSSTTP